VRIWAAETEGSGVRFLSLDPGEMDTNMHALAVPEADRSLLADPADVARAMADLFAAEGGLGAGPVRREIRVGSWA
jgi:NAD(P)-dependent dehydrogenase (short-subunit alcohol dehydrogenase family)